MDLMTIAALGWLAPLVSVAYFQALLWLLDERPKKR